MTFAGVGRHFARNATMSVGRRGRMEYRTIRVDFDDGVTTLTLDRPEKRNAMNPLLGEEAADALECRRRRIRPPR